MKKERKKEAERLWAENKYLVLSKSQAIYKEIREYLKREDPIPEEVRALIERALRLPENRGEMVNSFQHLWGYFKFLTDEEEKKRFSKHLALYMEEKEEASEVTKFLELLLLKYPNRYLEESNIFDYYKKGEEG